MIQYLYSINQKLDIMKGVFHNIESGIKMGIRELDGNYMRANQFSSAWIFELSIKSLWELSHSKVFDTAEINQYGHCIHNIYPCLKKEFCDFISNQYKVEVTRTRNELQEVCQNLSSADKEFILSRPYFTLEEALSTNSDIIKNGKFKLLDEKKINIITGIMPKSDLKINEVSCCKQPSPFLERIVNYIDTQLNPQDWETGLMGKRI